MLKNTYTQYGSVSKFLHWLIFLLILIMLCVGFVMDDIKNESVKDLVFNLHKLTGISILCLMIVRLIWALTNPKPLLPLDTTTWQLYAERIVQALIYISLIAMPISGWVMSVAAGYSPKLFGIALSLPLSKNEGLSHAAQKTHDTLAFIIIGLITVHILAAFYHYFIKKDNILQRMLPD